MNRKTVFRNIVASILCVVSVVAIIISVPLFHSSEAYATETISAEEIYKNALVAGLQTCYSSTYMNSNVNASGVTLDKVFTSTGKSDGKVIIPTYVGNTLKDSDMSCKDILSGYSGSGGVAKSIFSVFGKPAFSSSATGTNLVSLGYTPIASENAAPTGNYEVKVSFDYFKITNGSAGEKKNGYYVVTIDSNGAEVSSTANSCYSYSTTSAWPCVSAVPNSFWVQDGQLYGQIIVHGAFNGMYPDIGNGISIVLFGTEGVDFTYTGAIKCDGYYSDEQNVAYSCGTDGTIYKLSNFDVNVTFKPDESQVTSSAKYEITSFTSARAKLRLYLEASSYGTFHADDKKSLYYNHYILSVLKDSTNGATYVDNNDCLSSLTSEIQNSSSDYYLPSNGKWCRLVGSENATVKKNPADNDYKFAIIGSSTSMKKTSGTKAAAFQEVVKELMKISNSIDITDTNDIGQEVNNATNPTDPGNNDTNPSGGDVGALDGCFSNAGVLGWILCPVLRLAGAATDGIYDMIVENYLSVKSETITSEALRGSWGTFQGYANILFAILLVIVILSQVTGIGLSNYGVKKVLPKLIITIILVNLSYIICAIAVDLSNIVGTSLNDLLSGMDAGGFVASEINIGTMVINSVEGIGLTALAIGASGTVIKIAAEAWPNLILVLFLAVISILISILFFFILLVVRQAAIIIMVVIAPIAVVCYALPNTQKLFDRWLKAFSSLLMVFPICGAVMGGCNYASRLLLSAGGNNGLLYYIIVMVLGVVPLFFIPSILKTSMAALGNAGRMLAGAGDRFSRWANRAVVGSQFYQDRKQEAQRNVGLARNKRIMDGTRLNDTEKARLKDLRERRASLTGAERRELRGLSSREFRYARASSARERALREEQQAGVIADRGEYDYGTDRYMAGQEGFEVAQRLSDIKDHKALYESGQVSGVDVDNISSLEAEHAKLLAASIANPEDKETRAKLEAVQELLGEKKEDGLEAIHRNLQALAGDTSSNAGANLQSKGLKNAVRHLRGKFAGDIKGGNRAMDRLMTKIQNNDMDAIRTKAVGIKQSGDTRNLSDIIADEIAAESMAGYSANNLNDMHDAAIDRYIDMAENGHMEAAQIRNFAKLLNEAIASGTINLKGKVGVKAQQFLESAYAADAVANTSANAGVTTTGSSAFEHASLESLQNLSTGIRNGSINGSLAQNIVENARRYMESGALVEPERAAELRQIIAAAQQHGMTGLAGATDKFDYNEAAFKVRGAPEKLNSASLPKNWEQVRSNPLDLNSAMKWVEVTARDGSGRPTATRDLNEEELAHIRAVSRTNRERERENARRGFDPTPPSP